MLFRSGATHSYFGREDWSRLAPGLKSVDDATLIRSRLLAAFEQAEASVEAAERTRLLTFVIVGGGQAGYQTAASLRSEGYTEPIAILGDEAGVPYQRPPLSKALLLGKQDPDRLALRPANWYADRAVQWIPDTRVHSIDRSTRTVLAESGARFAYDHLVLATGAEPIVPPLPGLDRPEVRTLRTVPDADVLVQMLADGEIGRAHV
mgnify:CR=1 FL=1